MDSHTAPTVDLSAFRKAMGSSPNGSQRRHDDLARAAGHLKEGLALAAEAGDQSSAACYLEASAAVASQQENPRRAVRLLAAAGSLLETRSSGWPHAVVPRVPHYDAVLAPAWAARH